VKRRIEAGDLRQVWMTLAERLDQLDFAWQMIRCVPRCAAQFVEHVRRDSLWLRMRHPMDHAVSHGSDVCELLARFKPVDQETRRRHVVWHLRVTLEGRAFLRTPRECRSTSADPVEHSG
jgi:hypothetical protein